MTLSNAFGDRDDAYSAQPRGRTALHVSGSLGLLDILWRRKSLILGCVLLSLLAGVMTIAMTTPSYLASSMILIDPRLGKVIGSDPVQPGFVTDTGAMDSQIKLFTSQTVLARVAKMANLPDDPEFNGSRRGILDQILRPQPFLVGAVDLKALEDAITIKRPERTYVIQVDVLADRPDKAANIANDVVHAYIDDQIASRVDSAHDDSQFVRERLDRISAQIREADNKIEAYKATNNIVDVTGLRSNEQQVADLTRALSDAQAKASQEQAHLAQIDSLDQSGHLDSSSQALNSITIERLRQQQGEAEQTAARLAMTLGSRHPELLAAQGQVTKTAHLIHDELQRLKASIASNYQADKTAAQELQTQVDALKAQSNEMSQKLVPLQQLQRNADTLRASFARFSQVDDSLAQQQADSPPGRIIGVARPPVSPAKPKKSLILLIALSSGLFLGVALALFMEGTGPGLAVAARPSRIAEPVHVDPSEPETRYAGPFPAARPSAARAPQVPARRSTRRYWDDDDESA